MLDLCLDWLNSQKTNTPPLPSTHTSSKFKPILPQHFFYLSVSLLYILYCSPCHISCHMYSFILIVNLILT